MSDEKTDQPSSSSSQPSPSLPLDQSLVRVFGAVESLLNDLTKSSQGNNVELQKLINQITSLISKLSERWRIEDDHRESVLDAFLKLTTSFEGLAERTNISTGATIDARNALLGARAQLELSVKEITGQHQLLAAEDADSAPPKMRLIAVWIMDLGWKHKRKVLAGVSTVATGAWAYAAPSIWEAIKLLVHGG